MESSSFILLALFLISLIQTFTTMTTISGNPYYCNNTTPDCGSNNHSICYKGVCICDLGYKWNDTLFQCDIRPCELNITCQHWWPNTVCNMGHCNCSNLYHLDSKNQKCEPNSGAIPQSLNHFHIICLLSIGLFIRSLFH